MSDVLKRLLSLPTSGPIRFLTSSMITPSWPIFGHPTTESVRANFTTARDEINSIMEAIPFLINRTGDEMFGPLLVLEPDSARAAVPRDWVIGQLRSNINTLIYVGTYDAANDIISTSGQPELFLHGEPLPEPSEALAQHYFTVSAGSTTAIGNQPEGGVPGGSWLICDGINWNVFVFEAPGITSHGVPVDPQIPGLPGENVFQVLTSVGNRFDNVVGAVIGNTPPENPKPGMLWWDNTSGQLYLYFQDPTSSQWVAIQ